MSCSSSLMGWWAWPGQRLPNLGATPSSLPSDPTSCWLPLDMELLHRQLLALQTQRVLLGMWVGRAWDTWVSPRRVAPGSRCLLTASHPCTEKRRKASAWQRNLGYPLAMLCLLVLTVGIPALEVGSRLSVLEAFSGRGEAMRGPGYHQ